MRYWGPNGGIQDQKRLHIQAHSPKLLFKLQIILFLNPILGSLMFIVFGKKSDELSRLEVSNLRNIHILLSKPWQ